MGSGRFSTKEASVDMLMELFDQVAWEGLRSQGSKCSEVTHSLICGWSLQVRSLMSVVDSDF